MSHLIKQTVRDSINKTVQITCLLTCLLVASCDQQGARMSEAAEKCAKAVHVGALEVADELCTLALGESSGNDLKPALRSERLYRLGTIKRALAKYPEARDLMLQSLAIEENSQEASNPALGERLLELSLIMAGLDRWQEGATYLDRILPVAGQLDEQQQKSLARILGHYAGRLEKLQQAELAARFRDAQTTLQERW